MYVLKKKRPVYLMFIFCAVLLVIGSCNKKDDAVPGKSIEEGGVKGSAQKLSASKAEPAKVLVEVDGKKFTQAEADKEIDMRFSSAMGQIPEAQMAELRSKMLTETVEDFVTRTLLAEAVDREQITASDAEINETIDKIKKNLPQEMSFQDALQRNGITEEKLRTDVALGLRVNKILEAQVKDKNPPSDTEIADYYNTNKKQYEMPESVHARHVLVQTGEQDDQKAKEAKKAKAEGLKKQLDTGADFAKVAKEHSDCPSKEKGGDLGTFSRGQMVKQFEDAAFSQQINAIGPVIETQFGYHILQVLEHNQARTKSVDEVKDTISDTLQQKKLQEAAERYIADLKSKAKIVYAADIAPAAKN